jgi:hypothetical protein
MIRYGLILGGAAGLIIGVTLAMRPQAEELNPLQKIERERVREYSPDSAKVEFCTDTCGRIAETGARATADRQQSGATGNTTERGQDYFQVAVKIDSPCLWTILCRN